MNPKYIYKLRLRQDGTWENVYTDGSVDQEFAELSHIMLVKMQAKQLSEIAADYLEQAVEASGYRDAKELIAYIKNK
jgi:hypothetical protein